MDQLHTRAPMTSESENEDSDDWLERMTMQDLLGDQDSSSEYPTDSDSEASNLSHTSLQEAFAAGAFDTASDESDDEVVQYFQALSDSE